MRMTVVDEGRGDAPASTPVPSGAGRRRAGGLRRLLRNEVARFIAGGLLAACIIGVGTFFVVSRDAEDQAVGHAKDITQVEGRGIVQPALMDSLLNGDLTARASLDAIVRQRILGGDVVRVKLWKGDGTILYSDEPRLVGQHFHLDSGELAALNGGAVDAGVSDLTDPENQYEHSFGKLLQVYLGVHLPNGTPVLFETYQHYEAITQYQQSVWSSSLPVLIGGPAILSLVQFRRAADPIDAAAGDTRTAMRDLRTLIVEIAPPNLHAEGIDNALRDLLDPLARSGVGTSLDAPADTALSAQMTTLLFRVAQEAVRNAGKHAHASRVDVSLRNRGSHVRLEIADDGGGFSAADLDRRRRGGHVGLSLLRDLVADAGGTLLVESEPGRGTRVAVEVPSS